MNLKQLRYVLLLHDTGSFSQAAEILGISQPSFSQYIHKIEKQLGMQLFIRNGSDIRTTDAGKVFLEAGKQILEIERRMQQKFADLRDYHAGSVIVGISPHRCFCIGPQLVSEFRKCYPGMHLVLEERSGHDLMDCAARGFFDLCITGVPVDEQIFSYEPIICEEAVVAVPDTFPLCNKLKETAKPMANRRFPAIDVRLLDRADFAFLGEGMPMQVILDKMCSDYDLHLNKVVSCRSLEALEAMVSAGICAALIPSYLCHYKVKHSAVTCFSLCQEIASREIVAAYPKGQCLSRPVQDIISILKSLDV